MAVHIQNPNFFYTHHLRSRLTSSSTSPASYLISKHSASNYHSFICKSNNKDVSFVLTTPKVKSLYKKIEWLISSLILSGLSHWCSCFCWRWFLFQWRFITTTKLPFLLYSLGRRLNLDFLVGKYSDQPSPSDEWLKQGKWVGRIWIPLLFFLIHSFWLNIFDSWFFKVKAHRVGGSGVEAKDPIFGLTMGASSQASKDLFR